MLKLIKEEDRIILYYESELYDSSWVYREITEKGSVKLRNTFILTSNELISREDEEEEFAEQEFVPVLFEVARKDDPYYRFPQNILELSNDLFIHKDINLNIKMFIAERNISVFSKIDDLVQGSIYIGGPQENAIPKEAFQELLKNFQIHMN